MSEEPVEDVKAGIDQILFIGMRCRWRLPEEVPEIRQPIVVQWKGDFYDVLSLGILCEGAWETIGRKVLRWKYVE